MTRQRDWRDEYRWSPLPRGFVSVLQVVLGFGANFLSGGFLNTEGKTTKAGWKGILVFFAIWAALFAVVLVWIALRSGDRPPCDPVTYSTPTGDFCRP